MSSTGGDNEGWDVKPKDGHVHVHREARKDGTPRKVLRVRAGYTPPDEIPVYQTKGARLRKQEEEAKSLQEKLAKTNFFEEKPTPKPIETVKTESGATGISQSVSSTSNEQVSLTKTQKKNLQKKKKKQNQTNDKPAVVPQVTNPVTQQAPEAETPEKIKKRLQKKIRQIKEIKAKVDAGLLQPNEDQSKKLSQLVSLEDQLKSLNDS